MKPEWVKSPMSIEILLPQFNRKITVPANTRLRRFWVLTLEGPVHFYRPEELAGQND